MKSYCMGSVIGALALAGIAAGQSTSTTTDTQSVAARAGTAATAAVTDVTTGVGERVLLDSIAPKGVNWGKGSGFIGAGCVVECEDTEGEGDCGVPDDFVNGGCNSVPEVYIDVACGDTVCGTTAAEGGTRDTDWYRFSVTELSDVTVTGTGEFTGLYGIVGGLCDAPAFLGFANNVAPCTAGVATATVPAGTYAMFAAQATFDDLACGARYEMSLQCEPAQGGEGCDPQCDANAIDESEPDCGIPDDFVNGGCNSVPPVYTDIACGDSFCGTAGNDGGTRDTDWYRFTITETSDVTVTVRAEFAALIGVVTGLCDAPAFAFFLNGTTEDCTDNSATGLLSAGTYAAFVATTGFSGVECGARYAGLLECEAGGNPGCDPQCDANAIDEGEPDCGIPDDFVNGGCNSVPPVYTDIACGDSFCGTAGNDGGTRDTDWYRFTITETSTVDVTVRAEFAALIGVVTGLCDAPAFAFFLNGTTDDCTDNTASGLLSAGTYAAFVATTGFSGVECGARYAGLLECEAGGNPGCDPQCDANAIDEGEPDCGIPDDFTNGGCNSVPPVYTDIACGDSFCGTAGNDGGTRDTDWYRFTLTEDSLVNVTVRAEFAALIGVVTGLCDAPAFAFFLNGTTDDCTDNVATGQLAAGTYAAFVATTGFSGVECGARYAGLLECEGAGGPCDVDCPEGAINEDEPDCGIPDDFVNGGCNSTPPVYIDIACGDTVCGTVGNDGGTRDTDWYRFDVPADDCGVSWTVAGQDSLLIGVVTGLCDAPAFAFFVNGTSPDCENNTASGTLAAGTYAAFVATVGFSGVECGSAYVATLECDCAGEDCYPDCDGNGVVNAADVGCFLSGYFAIIGGGPFDPYFDCDDNGVVNAADVGCFLSEYFANLGPCP